MLPVSFTSATVNSHPSIDQLKMLNQLFSWFSFRIFWCDLKQILIIFLRRNQRLKQHLKLLIERHFVSDIDGFWLDDWLQIFEILSSSRPFYCKLIPEYHEKNLAYEVGLPDHLQNHRHHSGKVDQLYHLIEK